MKIKCSYCGTYIDDTLATCPNCGAPNEGVVRTTSTQPLTIEELKQWYQDRGLPPAETTRFFIGEDYKGPRAFGIYKDEKTGNCVVYKNKGNGERAVRYQGTDEAYAVNELFQRLKQEIIEQKSRSAGNSGSPQRNGSGKKDGGLLGILFRIVMGIFAAFVAIFIAAAVLIFAEDKPARGYYKYEGAPYYYSTESNDSAYEGWFAYDRDEWHGLIRPDAMPAALQKDKTAKKYYVSSEWDSTLGCTDFHDSIQYQDLLNHFKVDEGYYQYNNNVYYHLDDASELGWYLFAEEANDWHEVDFGDVPDELTHQTTADDFYYTPDWDTDTQITDFEDTEYFSEYEADRDSGSGSDSGWDNYDDDSDYDWDSGDSWDSWDSGGSNWDSDW
jgi:hypothetical protein